MMTPDQVKNVTLVYSELMRRESGNTWDNIDDLLDLLEYLEDDQLFREASVIEEIHKRGSVKCEVEHPIESCFMPKLVDAAGAILSLYRENRELHKNNRYILMYYLAFQQAGMIVLF